MKERKRSMALWLPYALLSGWIMCFMRVCFRLAGQIGLAGQENTLFIAICVGIVLGMLIPLPDPRKAWNKNRLIFCFASVAVIPCTLLAVNTQNLAANTQNLAVNTQNLAVNTQNLAANTQNPAALIWIALAFFFASAAMGCSLYRISLQAEQMNFGLFFGTGFAVSEGLLLVLLFLPFDRFPAAVAITVLCLLPVAALLAYRNNKPAEVQCADEPEPSALIPEKSALVKYLLALLLYCIMGGMLDNLTAFDDSFLGMPNMLRMIYLYSVAANLIIGALLRFINWNKLAMLGILVICIGHALPYFSTVSALAVPYLALTMTGVIIMEFLVRSLPVKYAGKTRYTAAVSRMGYAALYGGFLITSIIFEYIPRSRYFYIMGIVLLLAFAVVSLLYMAFSSEERRRYERIMRELRALAQENASNMPITPDAQAQQGTPDIEARMEKLGLTSREREVCALLLGAYSLKQVAFELQIAYGTANKHNTSIYRKLSINSKAELFQIFGVISSAADHN